MVEPAYSKKDHSHDGWDFDWITERFIAVMKCSDTSCGEIVIVGGDTEIVEEFDEDIGHNVYSNLRPRSIFPGPPIIAISKETPASVRHEIELAFQLFWSDLGASASRLRTGVERLLDDFKVPRTRA